MPEHRSEAEASNINLQSILFALFKWKWVILATTVVGLIAALVTYLLWPPIYESDAILLVRYVLDRSGYDSVDAMQGGKGGTGLSTDAVIAAEVSILTSWDLSVQVAQALGPKRVLPDVKSPTVNQAAGAINGGLTCSTTKGSNIIAVAYQNKNPDVATTVLNELVNRYFVRHLEVHRSAGAFDFVSEQTDQVRSRLAQTEDALKQVKNNVGVLDLKESIASLSNEASRSSEQLALAEGELAEQAAKVKIMEGAASAAPAAAIAPSPSPDSAGATPAATSSTAAPAATPTSAQTAQYQAIVSKLAQLRQAEIDLLNKYTSNSTQAKVMHSDIQDLERQKGDLEKKYPGLALSGSTSGGSDLASERGREAGMAAKVENLKHQLADALQRMRKLSDAAPEISRLERARELEEANYKYFEGTLEKARIDEALDPSKMPNISAVQRPSPPSKVTKTRDKVALGLCAAGLVAGLVFALGCELFLRKTVKRPLEIEGRLHTPLYLSIPYAATNGKLRLRYKKDGVNGNGTGPDHAHTELAPWDENHFIRPYSEAIRDRLGLQFELQGISHKPKLVGVTGFTEGAGTSTLAAGLAAALSQTGEGKVLLVDANVANGEAHPFFEGRPAMPLNGPLETATPESSPADNLYLATIGAANSNVGRVGLKKFFALMPNLKASDFDYVIFDLPPVNQVSPTVGLAGFMDKVLLVVEAEKNNRETVQRGYRDLMAARADVSVVLNKVRTYIPKWLDGER